LWHDCGLVTSPIVRSLNLDFFAVREDLALVLDYVYSETDLRVFESYSELGRELREFRSVDELVAAYPLGEDPGGNGSAILLMLWSPSVMRELRISRIELDPAHCNGHTFRHRIDGGGLIAFYPGGLSGRVITRTHLGHQSQARAAKWQADEGIDWAALKSLGGRIAHHVRKRLATGKAHGACVLPAAMRLAAAGHELKLATRTPASFAPAPFPPRKQPRRG
jgi:hypothetical protein